VIDLTQLTYENTRQYIGETFVIRIPDGREISLVVEDTAVLMEKHLNPRMARDSFAWYLRGPADFLLPQGLYALENEKIGTLGIFIVPVGRDTPGVLYEAIFN
jgi:hypothetical protein